MGVRITKHMETVMKWYRHFHVTWKFCLPYQKKHNMPPFLQQNPDICTLIQQYGHENLMRTSIKFMSEYIHNTILPQMVNERITTMMMLAINNMPGSEQVEYDEIKKEMLKSYGLTCVCPSTIYWWMKHLGFKYEAQKKGYYVDGHENPATVEYRWSFVQHYLNYEWRMFCWIQIPLSEAVKQEEDGKVSKHTGYW